MREAIGNTFIVNLLLVFIAVLSALLIGSIAYSKAYKVKNRIIFVIEKYGAWDVRSYRQCDAGYSEDCDENTNIVQMEIEMSLKEIGYHINLGGIPSCRGLEGAELVYGTTSGTRTNFAAGSSDYATYDYCVYEYRDLAGKGRYYAVTTFMHFNIPLIGNYLQFPVHGKTRVLYDVSANFNN